MPGLVSLTEEFGDRVGFFTVLLDMDTDRDAAVRITEDANAEFLTISADNSVFQAFGDYFGSGYIPESVLFDGEGNVLANIVGSNTEEYRASIENALNG